MSASADATPRPLGDGDQRLVELVASALVDPNIHTDMRMRLHRELTDVLRRTHGDLYGEAGGEAHERALADSGHHLPSVLETVLVDPNLHTDVRMRLHRQIQELLESHRTARGGGQ